MVKQIQIDGPISQMSSNSELGQKCYLLVRSYLDPKRETERETEVLIKHSEKVAFGVESSRIWFQSKSDFSPLCMT